MPYTIIENTVGYLPEHDHGIFTNKLDAQRSAAELANAYRSDFGDDEGGPRYRVRGNARDGYRITPLYTDWPLDIVIYVTECETQQ